MENINFISIILEAVVVIFGLMIAIKKRRGYGEGLALTFLIYVFYDLARLLGWQINDTFLSISFLVANISAVISIYSIYRDS